MLAQEPTPSPSIAIVTRTKNRPLLLRRCIETVLAQTYQDWVHVIVNDGGLREDVEALAAFHGAAYRGRLKVIHNPASVGMEAASNIGVRASRSKYLVVLDDDDTWMPLFLERMIAHRETTTWPNTRGVVCRTDIIFEQIAGSEVIELRRQAMNTRMERVDLFEMFAWNRFMPVSFLFDRDAMDSVGMFNEALPVCGDWDFNLRFVSHYEVDFLPENLAFYHQRPSATDVYGNTLHANWSDHRKYRVYMANKWAREGLRSGRIGFGEMFAMGNVLEYLGDTSPDRGRVPGGHRPFTRAYWRRKLSQIMKKAGE